ncbi:MAG: peptide-methionine (S)-S-oxide reductase, partial [Spirochaetaceae bacterium]|nr:peptide-methionine (S)-S-oxide reductase [Spirochaetaceae bacterium]
MTDTSERIILGGGCFWCIEAVYKRIQGVVATRPGYAGGHLDNPDYKQVCTGETGHAEVVEISYDPHVISTEAILEIFWRAHD